MKLKKIASMALAGVMAVSMLAGCEGGKGNGNGAAGEDDNVTATPTSIVEAVNDGQSAVNVVKIDFTTDSKLETALKRAVETLGIKATEQDVKTAIENITGYESKKATSFTSVDGTTGFLTNKFDYHANDNAKKQDGKVYTYFGVDKVDAETAATEEAALNIIAKNADEQIADLAKLSNDDDNDGKLDPDITVGGDKEYYSYSYDGSISMVSVENPEGTTDYYVAWIVNQTVTKNTLG